MGGIYYDENMCSPGDGIRMTYLIKFPHTTVDTHLLFNEKVHPRRQIKDINYKAQYMKYKNTDQTTD